MKENNKNYSIMNIGKFSDFHKKGRITVGEDLNLTGCEISINSLPADQSIPFVHSHKENEEVYIVIQGTGKFIVDGEEFAIQEGSLIRVAPAGQRVLKAGNEELIYLCMQVQNNSLKQATNDDGIIHETKVSWM